ncbi:SNF2-related protein [Streptomyces sp. SID5606]|uniref:SNF2-related protein n=1 Tax=Streptomyces sp. SID5606 TaxID=2690305 RepID=UPI00136EF2B6|nr:SNF2-related protein [Streptomyces sp. SID5606]MZD56575.1 helicase [Streptomyces sp. SID5606]
MTGDGGYQPEFATNRSSTERVADAINTLLAGLRTRLINPPRLAIATAYFNPGGFNLLAAELEKAGGVRLLLGAEPLKAEDQPRVRALGETAPRRRRRGPSPQVTRALQGHSRSMEEDRDLLGFTREADAQARRLVAWLRNNPAVQVKRFEDGFLHGKAFIVETGVPGVIAGSSNFTYAGLAKNRELNLGQYQPSTVQQVIDWFDEQWDAAVPYDLAALYEARWLPHQPWDVFLRMLFELYGADLDEDTAVNSRLGLTAFQADGVWRAHRILARRKGVLIADEVGLGKTFVAGELIHEAVFDRRQKVLIIAPATLRDATWRPFLREKNLRAEVLSYEELVADIEDAGSRTARLQDLDEYAMVVVDEAHALRNSKTKRADALRQVLSGPVPKDLVLLTATPVNNSLEDLYNLIAYFTPNDAAFSDVGIPSLRAYFQRAIAMNPDDLSPEHLFDVLDEIAVRRTRRFVKNHYVHDTVVINGVTQQIQFPTCRVVRVDYDLDKALPGVFDDLAVALGAEVAEETLADTLAAGVILDEPGEVLTMARYVPSRFRRGGQTEQYEAQNAGLLRSNLLKRFESSSHAFEQTVTKMILSHDRFLDALNNGLVLTGDALREWAVSSTDDVEEWLESVDDTDGIASAADYDVNALTAAVRADRDLLEAFRIRVGALHPSTDPKVEALVEELAAVAREAADEGIGEQDTRNKRKVLIFTYFADTASYLDGALRNAITTDPRLAAYRNRMATVSGPDKANRSEAIIGFAPQTAGTGTEDDAYDLIVTTDVLAEGVNLQQARHIVNYDLPWNPMRLVQRHGRIDRIGSPHSAVYMRTFFPDKDLDKILRLEERLQRKLKQAAASVGVGEVLPGIDPVERNISETRDRIEQIRREEAALFNDEGNAALSGEEYRRRLANAFRTSATKGRVLGLPWGAGTGFQRPGADPGFVFCARIGDHPKPWYRYVPLNADLTLQASGPNGEPLIVDDTLACLAHADPQTDTTPVVLPEEMYSAAFDAWAAAQQHIHGKWMLQTDPANLAPQVPKVMRDASALVRQHGVFLGDDQDTLAARLNAPYTLRVQQEVRHILIAANSSDADKIQALMALANQHGLTPPPPPPLRPVIDREDIHLVCWTVITPL